MDQLRQVVDNYLLLDYLPLSYEVLVEAAHLWAKARLAGKVPARGVDVDKIVLAHLEVEKRNFPGRNVIIATTNLKDFRLFSQEDAQAWQNIWL